MAPLALVVLLALLEPSTARKNETSNDQVSLFSFSLPYKVKFTHFLNKVTSNHRLAISGQCRSSLGQFADGLDTSDLNSLTMFDSFAKVKPGFMSIRFTDFGHYEQCLKNTWPPARYLVLQVNVNLTEVEVFPRNSLAQEHIRAQKPVFAICIPGACCESDVSAILKSKIVLSLVPYEMEILASEMRGEEQFADHKVLRFICRTVVLVIVAVSLGSNLLIRLFPKKYSAHPFISCFDLVANTHQLLREPENKLGTQFFDGIRAIFLIISVPGHYSFPLSPVLKPYFHPIFRAFSLDTNGIFVAQSIGFMNLINFILSSSLNLISWKSRFELKKGQIRYSSYLMSRLMRLYPIVILNLVLIGTLPWYSSMGGPLMNKWQRSSIDLLLKNGWKDLLFISNFQGTKDFPNPTGWYISSDMQLYSASFLVVHLMHNRPKLGLLMAFVMMTIGTILHWIYLSLVDASPTLTIASRRYDFERTVQLCHFNSINHISSYAVGLLLGYLIVHRVTVSKEAQRKILWASLVVLLLLVPTPAIVYGPPGLPRFSRTIELILGTFYRPLNCFALSSLFYILWLNPSSSVSKFLSSRPLAILSRLFSCMFLIHPFQIILQFASDKEAHVYSKVEMNVLSMYTLTSCALYSYLMFILIEFPLAQLARNWTQGKKLISSDEKVKTN